MTVAELDRTVWGPHLAFDPSSALENGPVNGGARVPCPGTVEVVGEPGDEVVLMQCDLCGYEAGMRRTHLEAPAPVPVERLERWWDR